VKRRERETKLRRSSKVWPCHQQQEYE